MSVSMAEVFDISAVTRRLFFDVKLGWHLVDRESTRELAGVYAIYRAGELIYIGSTENAYGRLWGSGHPLLEPGDSVKVRYSRPKTFEHLSREARLIWRLNPRCNRRYVVRSPGP